ncbi:MAG TPA: M14 family zinc carboxypeptidase [Candidatus Polarisedimenticolaceae bacterium]|nr:M14 family zinc carboxypeptidase [Candidatus Polarisedimenticolaceae bacterium]
MRRTCCLLGLLLAPLLALAAGRGERGPVFPARVALGDRQADLKTFRDLDLDVDGVYDTWARVYLVDEELDKLKLLGFSVTRLPDDAPRLAELAALEALGHVSPAPAVAAAYHTYETLTADLQALAAAHPDLVRLISLGTSVQGRQLWMVKLSANPDVNEDEPEVAYIAAMHGDEVVGKEMCYDLLDSLLAGYGVDPRITQLIDTTEIWIMPSMNPDGTALGQRYNAQGIDLNRNFPDQYDDPNNTPAGRAPEVQAVMNWGAPRRTVLSANYHGGSLVANYPFDGSASGSSIYTAAPDDSVFLSLSRTYADHNAPMRASNSDASFNNGVCNGADWYVIYGGMQDWNYIWRGNFEITLEISTIKWPSGSTLPQFWTDNREAMLSYFERAHEGIRGIVTDAVSGAPLAAEVRVVGDPFASHTDPAVGDYHRVMLPGAYDLEVSAPGYATQLVHGVNPALSAARYDVALEPLAVDLEPIAARVVDGGNGQLEPGESADLAVTLRDLGLAASGVDATLVPLSWNAQVVRAQAAYPDLATGGSAESLAPHFAAALAPGTPAGHKVGFALSWTSDQGQGLSEPFFVPAGAATCTTVAASGLPRPIQDRQTTASALSFPVDMEIEQVRATVNIAHTYINDLRVELQAPSGVTVALHDRSGGSSDNIVGNYPNTLAPFEPLSRFAGMHSGGTWGLRVNDGVPFNTGSIQSWSLEVCGRPFETAPPEMRLRDVTRAAGDVQLEWWRYPGLVSYRVYRSHDASSAAAFVDVTSTDPDPGDTRFVDADAAPLVFWLVTGVSANGEGPKGHFGQ